MNKAKLAKIKNKIKHHVPAIIATTSTAITIATVIYYKTKLSLDVTKEDLEVMQTGDTNLTYRIDGNRYDLRYIGNPKE